jgi:hypothetical protein
MKAKRVHFLEKVVFKAFLGPKNRVFSGYACLTAMLFFRTKINRHHYSKKHRKLQRSPNRLANPT